MSKMREAFESWASAPPREWSCSIHDTDSLWPGQYQSYFTQAAWEAWQAACAIDAQCRAAIAKATGEQQ